MNFELFFRESRLRITVEMVFDIRSFSRLAVMCFLCQALILSSVAGTRQKRSECGSDLYTDKGIIESPDYPGDYPLLSHCTWHITVAKGSRIMLTFQKFLIEQHSSCKYDYLEVRDGPSSESPLLSKLCGSRVPPPIESSGNKMTLMFKSDASNSLTGFRAEFSKVFGCGGKITSEEGNVTSPNYPHNYGKYEDCLWIVMVPSQYQIQFRFLSLQIEESPECLSDFVELHDGPDQHSQSLGRFCGSLLPEEIQSSENILAVRFKSDSSNEKKGFSAHFKKVVVCGGTIISEEGNVTSPNYPHNYGKSEDCIWIVIVPRQYQIKLRFRSMQIEETPGCLSDYVEVHDGPDLHFQALGRFCGSDMPEEIRSSGNILTVRFVSDSSNEKTGFSAHFIKVKPGAEELKSIGTGNILLASAVLIILCLTLLSSI